MNKMYQILNKSIKDVIYYDKKNAMENIIKLVFEGILKAERSNFLQDSFEQNKGNGFYPRMVKGINKYLKLEIPRDRLSLFKPVFLEAIKEQDAKIQDLAFKLYVKGLTTREINEILSDAFGKKMSATSVSNITKEFEEVRKSWLKKPLDSEYYFIYIDALWISVRRGKTVAKEAFYIVVGLKKDLTREILGVYNIPVETAAGWQEVLQNLKERGLKKVLMIIADGIANLEDAIMKELPGTQLQKCVLHKIRNILLMVRSSHKQEIAADLKEVFQIGNPAYSNKQANDNLDKFVNKWSEIYPYIKRKFDPKTTQYYFSYLQFPYQIQRMIYTTNWIERLNKSIRRTQRIRNSFPNPDSAMNLICAHLMDFEKRVYSYPVTSFTLTVGKLNEMFFNDPRTQFS